MPKLARSHKRKITQMPMRPEKLSQTVELRKTLEAPCKPSVMAIQGELKCAFDTLAD